MIKSNLIYNSAKEATKPNSFVKHLLNIEDIAFQVTDPPFNKADTDVLPLDPPFKKKV